MPLFTEIRDRIGEVIIDHPPVNALDSSLWAAIPGLLHDLGQNPSLHCVLIHARGKGFCGGVDIKEMQAHPDRIIALNRGNYESFRAVRACPLPVVSAVHGFVIGGGIGIAGASDVILAADDAYFSLPEIDRGAMGGASHLLRMLPLHKVRAAFLTGGKISAQDAFSLGAIEKIVPPDQLLASARAFCDIIAGKSRAALILAKEALNGLEERDVDRGYRFEQGFTLEMYRHEDSQKARDAFVRHKQQATF